MRKRTNGTVWATDTNRGIGVICLERRIIKKKEKMMTREQELLQINDYIKENGVTLLPKDERGPDFVAISAWGKPRRKKAKKAKNTKK